MPYTSVENVKSYLGILNTVDDALFERLVNAASAFIDTYINRTLDVAEYTDTFDGNGSHQFVLRNYPVAAVSAVTVNTQVIPAAANARSNGYRFDKFRVVLQGYEFYSGALNCSVTYEAGYETVPADIEQACIEIVVNRYKEKDRIGLTSKGLAGEMTAYSTRDIPESSATVLNKYKRVVPT
jgi:hypothetical protein